MHQPFNLTKIKHITLLLSSALLISGLTQAAPMKPDKQKVIDFWTPEKIAKAIPRDLVMDERGRGYLRKPDGSLIPYGLIRSGQNIIRPTMGKPDGAGGGDKGGGKGGGGTDDGGTTGGDDRYTVKKAEWTNGGDVQTAVGRIYYVFQDTPYVCSGTVAKDGISDRSIILTAAHCVYDDINKAFASNVLFIPNQAGTTARSTDSDCSNDPLGCWVASLGVVDINYTERTYPDNQAWDYGYYVVDDNDRTDAAGEPEVLDSIAGALDISFALPDVEDGIDAADSPDFTHALGYSYKDDPKFMYCADDMTNEGNNINWWLDVCNLTGGSSGGPWIQQMDVANGTGEIISVNSWGYVRARTGMAGPKFSGTSAECLFGVAKTAAFSDADAGGIAHLCQ